MKNYNLTVCYYETDENGEAVGNLLEYRKTCYCKGEALDAMQRLPQKWDITDIRITIRQQPPRHVSDVCRKCEPGQRYSRQKLVPFSSFRM